MAWPMISRGIFCDECKTPVGAGLGLRFGPEFFTRSLSLNPFAPLGSCDNGSPMIRE